MAVRPIGGTASDLSDDTVMISSRTPAFTTLLASLALVLSSGAALADRDHDDDHRHKHKHHHAHGKDRRDRPEVIVVERDTRPEIIVVGRPLPRTAYRVLDPDLYYRSHGRRIDDRYRYVEVYDGSRVLIDLASGVIAEILYDAIR